MDLACQELGVQNRVLETIEREIDFSLAEARVGATYSPQGRPGHPVEVLLRVMLLQHIYGLSDPQAEEQIGDRLSFRRFLGLGLEARVPDETTICRFRQRLIASGLHEDLPELLEEQLTVKGYLLKRTTLVDATLVSSSRRKPTREECEQGTAPCVMPWRKKPSSRPW